MRYSDEDRNPVIVISGEETHKDFIFHIEDNGIGIGKEYIEEIFQMFKKLNPDKKDDGSGIGLAIYSKLVELHKGRIWVKCNLEEGSIFSFSIPK